MEVYTEDRAEEQAPKIPVADTPLTPADRRLLLGSSLRLLSHRFICGKSILQDDLLRMASLADDAAERAA